ncbi:hypothetical protein [uncultured Aquimarina sp.]|uniref:hypothetical protein n=1 Tax=uncultured Aquimarina sp. TaxID=575652 RepID=UPI002603878C|nr:hypothetical protein [uncultured Aquimarina sp.]
MNYIIYKPYIIFWSLIPIMLIYGFSFDEETLDINIHDTYFVISIAHLFNFLSLLFFGIGLTYYAIHKLNKKRQPLLTYIHLIGTLGGILILALLPLLFTSESDWETKETLFITQLILFLIILTVQPILLLHLMISIFRKTVKN